MNVTELQNIIDECYTKTELSNKLGYKYYNGTTSREINKLIEEYNLDISHFDSSIKNRRRRKYDKVEKECPICGKKFITESGKKREKTTCSHSCANVYFRSGIDNPNWSDKSYRTTCFMYHEKKCIICGEDRIVEVHHYDQNHNNTSPENLIPLCPTHHQYIHSRYKTLIESKMDNFRNEFIKKNK